MNMHNPKVRRIIAIFILIIIAAMVAGMIIPYLV